MNEQEAIREAQKLFGPNGIAVVGKDEFRRPDASGTIPPPIVRYIIGYEKNGVPTYMGIGETWEEAIKKAKE